MGDHKWLLRKSSGSRAEGKPGLEYADDRHLAKFVDAEDLPTHLGMGRSQRGWNMDTTLVYRFLGSNVGRPFDEVYSEFLSRIQPKYLDQYRECIYWYVARHNIEIRDDGLVYGSIEYGKHLMQPLPFSYRGKFFVHPQTGILSKISDLQYAQRFSRNYE